MNKETLIKRNENESGSIGIGAMIVFIALILVAAVASTVIIKTAEELQDRAEKTGDDTRDQISGKLIVTDVYISTDDDADGDIDGLVVIAKLASGSDATLETAMTYMIVCNAGGFRTDTAQVDAVTLANVDIAATTPLTSGEMFRFAIPLDVKSPTSRAPSVFRFSSPKEIFPPDEVIDPSASVRFPIVDPAPIVATPVVIFPAVFKLLFPKETVPLLSVISFPSKLSVPIIASEPEEFEGTSMLVNFPVDAIFSPMETPSIKPPVRLIELESCVERLPKPKEDLAKESLSTVQSVPSETIKFPSLFCKSAIVIKLESTSCLVST